MAGIRENWTQFVDLWVAQHRGWLPYDATAFEQHAAGAGISASELATALASAGIEKAQLGGPLGPTVYRIATP